MPKYFPCSSLSKTLLAARYFIFFLCCSVISSKALAIPDTNICFNNPDNYAEPYIYFWNESPTGSVTPVGWPGVQMTPIDGYYCYDFGVTLNSLSVIFNNNGNPQTGDLTYPGGGNNCYENGTWKSLQECGFNTGGGEDLVIYFRNDANYNEPHIHYFNLNPQQANSNWPGPAMSPLGNNWYLYDFNSPVTSGGIVFNDNGAPQTGDLTINPDTPCFQNNTFVSMAQCEYVPLTPTPTPTATPTPTLTPTPTPTPEYNFPAGNAVYFLNSNNWQTPTAYLWNETPEGSVADMGWPGVNMTDFGGLDLWYVDIGDDTTRGNIIFSNNGNDQTGDLEYLNGNFCYNNGTWMTPTQCGVPEQLDNAEAGPDRQANQHSRIALSAIASETDTSGATWTSDAWSGQLIGATAVTPELSTTGTFSVNLSLGNGQTDSFQLTVVSATRGLPERPLLAAPLAFPTTGSVASGNYEFEIAFPNLEGMFSSPVMVTHDGVNDLIYVVDKPGTITVFANEQSVTQAETTQLIDIRDEVRDYHEQGLISIAFHPQFSQNGYLYLYYIEGENDEESSGGSFDDGVLQRVTLNSTTNPTGIMAGSRVDVLRVPQVGPDHKGGKMEFHPQTGLFYMSIGDGGYGATAIDPDPADPRTNNSAQETDNLLGTFIRLEMLDEPVDGKYYSVPTDNPFVGDPNILDEIWSYGHRNPWRWSFDSQAPHTLWETEVGQSGFEEINIIEAGQNYGWPICEGETHRGNAGGDPNNTRQCTGDLTGPVEGYAHSTGSVAIIGGFIYRGSALSALHGRFIFGDFVSKRIWTIAEGENKALMSDGFPGNISSFGSDLAGEEIFISTHATDFGGGVSGIYRVVDRDAQAAVIPSTLSATGLFADLESLFPSSGIIEYDVNSDGWFDGVITRHFISVPNGQTINFSTTDTWDLPVGSVLVKHIEIPTSATQSRAHETSVLFRQTTGWAAANYLWNASGTDADLVTSSQTISVQQYLNGSVANVTRTVRAGNECGSCHTGIGTKNPRNLVTRQLNRSFEYQGFTDDQLDVFNAINLFSSALSSASNYDAYVDPANTNADINERAKVYLDTNCASCHSGSLMDLRYDTPLADMDIMNQSVGGDQFRMRPFSHTNSLLYAFQTTDSNRMPKGSSITNPMAEELFRAWIDGVGANQVGVLVKVAEDADEIRVGAEINLSAFAQYDNGFEAVPTTSVDWFSDNSSIVDVSGISGAVVAIRPSAEGVVNVSAAISGNSGAITLNVLGGPDAPENFTATALSSTAISLSWTDASNDESGFTLARSTHSSGPFTEFVSLAANSESYVDTGLSPDTRYYYQIRAVSSDGPSVPATAFADTQEAGSVDSISIETGNDFQLILGESRQLVAIALSGEEASSATLSATWSSSDSSIVSVSSSGVVTGGLNAGTALITATLDGQSGSVQIINRGAGHYVYFNNDSTSWEEVRIHVWSTSGGVETDQTAWPGDTMEPSVEYGGKWLRYAILDSMQGTQATEVIFNCGSSACQTADLTLDLSTPSWFEDVNATQWLTQAPIGGGAVNVGTQIVVGRGSLTWANNGENLTGTLLTPGALVDIVADDPGTGQSFTAWEGTAAAYMLDPNNPSTQILVPNALSLTINAVFDTVVDEYAEGRELFRSSALGCSGCHGAEGDGSPSLRNVPNERTLEDLVSFIETNMPPLPNSPSDCVGDCARAIAEMIMAEAYTEPEGVCNFESVDDVVPQDRGYRLLTVYEYNNSVRDLLGLSHDVDVTSGNLPVDIPANGFKTNADTIFTDDYAQGYVNAASQVADLAGNSISGLEPSCGNDSNCFIREFGKKVFRRPLTSTERADLQTLHSQEGDRALLITLFSAPAMLYRSEVGQLITSGDLIGYYALSDYEVASLLSYTYWGTTPDANLMALADAGQLSSSEQIRNQAAAMLNDPKAEVAFERFILGWLNLDTDISTNVLSDSLKADMKEETLRFVKSIVFGGGTYHDLITADYSYMTEQLAAHYNLPWPGGSGWQQVFYSGDNAQRRGVLGHASILSIQSAQEKTHPVKRGLFVRRNLMCQDFPPPPLGAALDPESDPSQGVRYRFETSHAQPGCENCHQYIDGIGFGLESYNAIGQFVTTETTDDGTVLAINASGYIGSLNSAETFLSEKEPVIDYLGLDQLSSLIADSTNGKACFARQWFRYARGRHETPEDSCTLQGYSQSFKATANSNLVDLMIDYTQTNNFTLRK